MIKKLWFQLGVGILLTLFIIKYFVEVWWIFAPLVIIVKTIFLPLLLGGVLFYMTEPIQSFLEKRKFPRWASIFTILVGLLAIVWAFVAVIGPPVTDQVNKLVKNAPAITAEVTNLVDYVVDQEKDLPPKVQESIATAVESVQAIGIQFGKWVVQFIQSFLQAMVLLVLVPFFFIFILKDHEKFAPLIYGLFTGKRREWIKKTLHDMDVVLRSYIQGQLLISFLLAIILFIGYKIIGLEYALLLVIFALFMNLIPFIGPWIAFAPALVIALVQDPKIVIWVALVTLVAQQIDSNLITPNVMGKTLDIHPLTVITIILAAGNIAGFLGIIVAIPTYAVGKAIVRNIYAARKEISNAATKTV
ncbi:AI-2E family transporter [Sporosarcina sp. CAU 1771]